MGKVLALFFKYALGDNFAGWEFFFFFFATAIYLFIDF